MRPPPFQTAPARDRAIARMNDGHALLLAGARADLTAALTAYDDAIALLRPLAAASSPSTCNSLAAALMNRGEILRRLHGPARLADAVIAFTKAAGLLRQLPSAGHPAWRRNLVGTLLNHATLLLAAQPANPAAAELIEEALALLHAARPDETNHPPRLPAGAAAPVGTDRRAVREHPDGAPSGRALLCPAPVKIDPALAPLAAQLVRLGALFYAAHQPHFLAEFLRENLPLVPADSGLVAGLRQSLDLARRRLLDRWLVSENSLPATRLLDAIADLRVLRATLGEAPAPGGGALPALPAPALIPQSAGRTPHFSAFA